MDLMSLAQLLGNLGEFVGAVAVVATLAFLVVQVRQTKSALNENSRLTAITVMDQHTQAQSRWRGRVAENGELARIWLTARDGVESLNQVDGLRFSQHAIDFFNTWRSSYASAMQTAHLGQLEHIVQSCVNILKSHQGMSETWMRTARGYSAMVVPEFAEAIDQRLGLGSGEESN